MNRRTAWVAVALLGVIGCGQKGPLYLPEHTGAVVTRPGAGAQNTGTTPGTQQPANGAAPAPTTTPGAAKKSSGKDDDDSSQK